MGDELEIVVCPEVTKILEKVAGMCVPEPQREAIVRVWTKQLGFAASNMAVLQNFAQSEHWKVPQEKGLRPEIKAQIETELKLLKQSPPVKAAASGQGVGPAIQPKLSTCCENPNRTICGRRYEAIIPEEATVVPDIVPKYVECMSAEELEFCVNGASSLRTLLNPGNQPCCLLVLLNTLLLLQKIRLPGDGESHLPSALVKPLRALYRASQPRFSKRQLRDNLSKMYGYVKCTIHDHRLPKVDTQRQNNQLRMFGAAGITILHDMLLEGKTKKKDDQFWNNLRKEDLVKEGDYAVWYHDEKGAYRTITRHNGEFYYLYDGTTETELVWISCEGASEKWLNDKFQEPRAQEGLQFSPLLPETPTSYKWNSHDMERLRIKPTPETSCPDNLSQLFDWLANDERSVSAVAAKTVAHDMDPVLHSYIFGTSNRTHEIILVDDGMPFTKSGSEPPEIDPEDTYACYYSRLLTTTWSNSRKLQSDEQVGSNETLTATEATWRSTVYSDFDSILHSTHPGLSLERNSQALPIMLLGGKPRPDMQVGIRKAFATGRLCWVYLDVEERRGRENEDRTKLLCIMAARLKYAAARLNHDDIISGALGMLRAGPLWSVAMMWPSKMATRTSQGQEGERMEYKWRWLFHDRTLHNPGDFLSHAAFMCRLNEAGMSEGRQKDSDQILDRLYLSSSDDQVWHPRERNPRYYGEGLLLYESSTHAVYRRTRRKDGQKVVVKLIDEEDEDNFIHECQVYNYLAGQGYTPELYANMYDAWEDRFCIELEYIPTINRHFRPRNTHELKNYIAGALQALWFIHSMGVIHRDIKPSNFLVCKDPKRPGWLQVKLADFEGALINAPEDEWYGRGTQGYVPPEIDCPEPQSWTKAGDMWGIGIILLEVMFYMELGGMQDEALALAQKLHDMPRAPFEKNYYSIIEQVAAVSRDKPYIMEYAFFFQPEAYQLCLALLHPDPTQRPTAEDALEFKLFAA